ncbi:MAG: hypothetical protein CUN53_08950 [Phototrophicales bacterium]|nr:MAG: hypothetical protein CUN53_08950 [Phototrophicales bacterium]
MTKKPAAPAARQTLLSRWIDGMVRRTLRFSRIGRILVCAVIALATTVTIRPLIDLVYLDYFYDPGTVIVPAWIATAVGIAVYAVGWRLVVGMAGEVPQPNRAAVYYLVVGVGLIVYIVVLTVHGLITAVFEV